MTRLTHSYAAYRRAMQMSRDNLFVFVEGKTDVFFYGELCRSVCLPKGIDYALRRADELPSNTGGKQSLLSFFEYMNRSSSLLDNFKGKTTVVAFFLDKDVDDVLKTKKVSPHVIYTQHYTIENYLYRETNLSRAAAIASSLEHRFVADKLGSEEDWRRRVAESWKDWVKMCLFAKIKDLRCECTFSAKSRINVPLHGPVEQGAYARCLSILQSCSGLNPKQFQRAFKKVSGIVDAAYNGGQHDLFFKGKWYELFVVEEIKQIAASTPYDSDGINPKIRSSVMSLMNFDAPWADHLKLPLLHLINHI